jgi:5-amino-6-(5-phosphoribosylamino)uracil reductase
LCWDDLVQPLLPADDDLDDERLAQRYAYPEQLGAPFVRANFVASADGAVSVDGRSAGLGSPADHRVFVMLRRLADVILVGAGTARAEDYRGARKPTRGRDAPPPIVLTLASAPPERRERLAAAGGDVVALDRLTPDLVLAELARRGLRRVLCEGGPTLFGELVAADAVDELCLTVSPVLVGGTAGRIATGPASEHRQPLELADALHEDGVLLLRYRRAGAATPIG